jgi:hypothetical protein
MSLDPQELVATGLDQRGERGGEWLPGDRCIKPDAEGVNAEMIASS